MMNLVLNSLNRLHKDEAGQGLVEYLLILALVAFGAVAGMTTSALCLWGGHSCPPPFAL